MLRVLVHGASVAKGHLQGPFVYASGMMDEFDQDLQDCDYLHLIDSLNNNFLIRMLFKDSY